MKIKKINFEIFYLISLIFFLLTTFLFFPKPRLKKFVLDSNNKDQLLRTEKLSFKKVNSKIINRKINIGVSYFVSLNNKVEFEITPISTWRKKKFNLSDYAKYFPKIIIDTNNIKTLGISNYGIVNTLNDEKYQACLNLKDGSFIYKSDNENIVYRYNDYEFWFNFLRYQILILFKPISYQNYNCLLITSSDPKIFSDYSQDLIENISSNFIYE